MRPIKFRAFDKIDKRMVYQDWGSFRNWYNESAVGKVVYERGFDGEKLRLSDPMQFTGLHDKNGKEIWEGDIVSSDPGDEEKRIGVVEFEAPKFVAKLTIVNKSKKSHTESYSYALKVCEVLGNIYENPTLLEVKG